MNPPTSRPLPRRVPRCGVALLALAVPVAMLPPAAAAGPATGPAGIVASTSAPAPGALTNLDHLDWLTVTVDPPEQEGHTTYRLEEEPELGVLWTYAEPNPDGSYRHVGGGEYDEATDTWSQGAFNADDVTRAAIVYLRHWQATGDENSRDQAYQLLRGVTYLQTAAGEHAGNVVLWMQPDGTLNPSAEPVELPDPSDSDASYWLARTIWALGEGYAGFADEDPEFAEFLGDRLELSIEAVDRQVLDKYGQHLNIDGERAPAWLIVDGADASAEAILGLSAYVDAGGSTNAREALHRLAEGVAILAGGNAQAGASRLTVTTATGDEPAKLDAVMLEPAVSRLVLRGGGHGTALLSSASDRVERAVVWVAGSGLATIETYDGRGRPIRTRVTRARAVPVAVPAGGFALVTR